MTSSIELKRLFAEDYFQARANFLAAVAARAVSVQSFPIKSRGLSNEELLIDVAWIGQSDAKNVLLHISGTHGVEGFVGSAIQLAILASNFKVPDDCAVAFVHCLNPWGMAHLRRVNENNVDLNRNLRLDGNFTGAPSGYHQINSFLNPSGAVFPFDFFLFKALRILWGMGMRDFTQAVAGGQCEFNRGLYFAGRQLEESNLILMDWVKQNLGTASQIVAIEVHSGLGSFGQQTLFTNLALSDPRAKQLAALFGQELSSDDPNEGIGFRTPGDLMHSVPALLPTTKVSWILQEFGTYPKIEVLKALRAENQYQHNSDKIDLNHWTKLDLLDTFNPPDVGWRNGVVAKGLDLFSKALFQAGA